MGWRRAIGYRQPSMRTIMLGRRRSSGGGLVGSLLMLALILTFLPFWLGWKLLAWAFGAAASNEQRAAAEEAQRQHLAALCQRFGPHLGPRVAAGELWQGQHSDMVLAGLGQPASVDEKVLKSKTKHTLKYYPGPSGRFGLCIFIENGVVVGWKK